MTFNFDIRETAPDRSASYNTPAASMDRPLDRFIYWVNERQSVLLNRSKGKPKPWTNDAILRDFKFCNVRREDDRVTRWVKNNWRDPHYTDPRAWFSMSLARMINWPDTLAAIGYPSSWRPTAVKKIMDGRMEAGHQVFTGAYMVTNAGMAVSKTDAVIHMMSNLRRLKEHPVRTDSLAAAHAKLRASACSGMGSFIAAQVVADCKHMDLLRNATDWYDWAAPGPGSLRGLSRLLLQPAPKQPAGFIDALRTLRRQAQRKFKHYVPELCLQDIQNCLCEFDKYERTLWGEGRPRSKYPGAAA